MLTSRYMVLERKSMPIVAWYVLSKLSYINLKRDDINTLDVQEMIRDSTL